MIGVKTSKDERIQFININYTIFKKPNQCIDMNISPTDIYFIFHNLIMHVVCMT